MQNDDSPENVVSNDNFRHIDPARDAFERHVLKWTGRDMAYHNRNGTTGIEFAWDCWQAGRADVIAPAPIAVMPSASAKQPCMWPRCNCPRNRCDRL